MYRGSYMVNWSPNLQTAVSDLEVEFFDEEVDLYFFKYPISGTEDHVPVATTRPETILGDTAVRTDRKPRAPATSGFDIACRLDNLCPPPLAFPTVCAVIRVYRPNTSGPWQSISPFTLST